MSAPTKPLGIPAELLTELQGLSYAWVLGTKHWQLRINGEFVGIWPRGNIGSTGRTKPWIGMRANIRRWKRGHNRAA